MTDEELLEELHFLGIDEGSYMVVALLPLVQVGWADGRIQSKEHAVIEGAARQRGLLAGDGARILHSWLSHPPTYEYQERGRQVLVELARRRGDMGQEFTLDTLDEILELCEAVAAAAGGLFGIIGRVEDSEREAIAEIAHSLDVARSVTWEELAAELE